MLPEELRAIERAASNPIYRQGFAADLSTARTAITRVSPRHGIIFPFGTSDSGFQHIQERHDYYDGRQTWSAKPSKDGSTSIHLDEHPSRFGPRELLIETLPLVVDDILSNPSEKPSQNTRPDMFDVLEGTWTDHAEKKWVCKLILYKGTHIVHTVYPKRTPHRKKKIVDFVRGDAIASLGAKEGEVKLRIIVPYLDHLGRIAYQLIVERDYDQTQCMARIEAFDHEKRTGRSFFFGTIERPPLQIGKEETEIRWWSVVDLEPVEKRILALDQHRKGITT